MFLIFTTLLKAQLQSELEMKIIAAERPQGASSNIIRI